MKINTWHDIERRAQTDAHLHFMVTIVNRGDYTREQGLIASALALSDVAEELRLEVIRLMSLLPAGQLP